MGFYKRLFGSSSRKKEKKLTEKARKESPKSGESSDQIKTDFVGPSEKALELATNTNSPSDAQNSFHTSSIDSISEEKKEITRRKDKSTDSADLAAEVRKYRLRHSGRDISKQYTVFETETICNDTELQRDKEENEVVIRSSVGETPYFVRISNVSLSIDPSSRALFEGMVCYRIEFRLDNGVWNTGTAPVDSETHSVEFGEGCTVDLPCMFPGLVPPPPESSLTRLAPTTWITCTIHRHTANTHEVCGTCRSAVLRTSLHNPSHVSEFILDERDPSPHGIIKFTIECIPRIEVVLVRSRDKHPSSDASTDTSVHRMKKWALLSRSVAPMLGTVADSNAEGFDDSKELGMIYDMRFGLLRQACLSFERSLSIEDDMFGDHGVLIDRRIIKNLTEGDAKLLRTTPSIGRELGSNFHESSMLLSSNSFTPSSPGIDSPASLLSPSGNLTSDGEEDGESQRGNCIEVNPASVVDTARNKYVMALRKLKRHGGTAKILDVMEDIFYDVEDICNRRENATSDLSTRSLTSNGKVGSISSTFDENNKDACVVKNPFQEESRLRWPSLRCTLCPADAAPLDWYPTQNCFILSYRLESSHQDKEMREKNETLQIPRMMHEYFMAPDRETFQVWTIALGFASHFSRGGAVEEELLLTLAQIHPALVSKVRNRVIISSYLLRPNGNFKESSLWSSINPLEQLGRVPCRRWFSLEIEKDGSCVLLSRQCEDGNVVGSIRYHRTGQRDESQPWELTFVEHSLPASGIMLEMSLEQLKHNTAVDVFSSGHVCGDGPHSKMERGRRLDSPGGCCAKVTVDCTCLTRSSAESTKAKLGKQGINMMKNGTKAYFAVPLHDHQLPPSVRFWSLSAEDGKRRQQQNKLDGWNWTFEIPGIPCGPVVPLKPWGTWGPVGKQITTALEVHISEKGNSDSTSNQFFCFDIPRDIDLDTPVHVKKVLVSYQAQQDHKQDIPGLEVPSIGPRTLGSESSDLSATPLERFQPIITVRRNSLTAIYWPCTLSVPAAMGDVTSSVADTGFGSDKNGLCSHMHLLCGLTHLELFHDSHPKFDSSNNESSCEGVLRIAFEDIKYVVPSTKAVVHLLISATSLGGRGYAEWEAKRRRYQKRNAFNVPISIVVLTIVPCPAIALVHHIRDRKKMAYHRRRLVELVREWHIPDRSGTQFQQIFNDSVKLFGELRKEIRSEERVLEVEYHKRGSNSSTDIDSASSKLIQQFRRMLRLRFYIWIIIDERIVHREFLGDDVRMSLELFFQNNIRNLLISEYVTSGYVTPGFDGTVKRLTLLYGQLERWLDECWMAYPQNVPRVKKAMGIMATQVFIASAAEVGRFVASHSAVDTFEIGDIIAACAYVHGDKGTATRLHKLLAEHGFAAHYQRWVSNVKLESVREKVNSTIFYGSDNDNDDSGDETTKMQRGLKAQLLRRSRGRISRSMTSTILSNCPAVDALNSQTDKMRRMDENSRLAFSQKQFELSLSAFINLPMLFRWISPRVKKDICTMIDRLMSQAIKETQSGDERNVKAKENTTWPTEYMDCVRAWNGDTVLFSTLPSSLVQTVSSMFMKNYVNAWPTNVSFIGVALRSSICALALAGARYQGLVNTLVSSYINRKPIGIGSEPDEQCLNCIKLLAAIINDMNEMIFKYIDEIKEEYQDTAKAENIDLWPLKVIFARVGNDAAGLLAAILISQVDWTDRVAMKPLLKEVKYQDRASDDEMSCFVLSETLDDLKAMILDSFKVIDRLLSPYFLRTVKIKIRAGMFAMLESRLLAWLMTVKQKSLSAAHLKEIAKVLSNKILSISEMLENEFGIHKKGERETALQTLVTVLNLVGSGERSLWRPLLAVQDAAIAHALVLTLSTWEGSIARDMKESKKAVAKLTSTPLSESDIISSGVLRYARELATNLASSKELTMMRRGKLAIQEEIALFHTMIYEHSMTGSTGSSTDASSEIANHKATHILIVQILQAMDLKDADYYFGTTAKSDPYCIVEIMEPLLTCKEGRNGEVLQSFRTKTCRNTLQPIWKDEVFEFKIMSLYTQRLQLHLMDSDTLLGSKKLASDDHLGTVNIDLGAEVQVGFPPQISWRDVEGERGRLQLSLELKEL